jgi:hypothetical protein
MIKIQTGKRTIRETTAPFETTDDDGNVQTQDIRVLYYSFTTKDHKDRRARIVAHQKENPDEPLWLSHLIVDQIHSLPDLVDTKGKPFKITEDFLDTLDVKNLEAIKNAIEEAVRPKDQPEK